MLSCGVAGYLADMFKNSSRVKGFVFSIGDNVGHMFPPNSTAILTLLSSSLGLDHHLAVCRNAGQRVIRPEITVLARITQERRHGWSRMSGEGCLEEVQLQSRNGLTFPA